MTLYTEGFGRFVTSTTAPIATGWSDSCRVGISPTERTRLTRRTEISGLVLPIVAGRVSPRCAARTKLTSYVRYPTYIPLAFGEHIQ